MTTQVSKLDSQVNFFSRLGPSHICFLFIFLCLLVCFFNLRGHKLLIFFAFLVQVVHVKGSHQVLLLEEELLHFPLDNGRHPAQLFSLLEHDHGGQLPGERRGVDVVLLSLLGIPEG